MTAVLVSHLLNVCSVYSNLSKDIYGLKTNSGLNNFVKFRAGDILLSFHQSVSCPNERVTMVVSKPFILQCLTTVFTGVILTLLSG